MATTIHGWPVIENADDPRLRLFDIPGVPGRTMRLRKDIGPYLVAFASRYHERIAPLNVGTWDDWAWSPPRLGRASSSISDHCAGVAIDLNATKEGAQNRDNWLSFWKKPVTWIRLQILRRRFQQPGVAVHIGHGEVSRGIIGAALDQGLGFGGFVQLVVALGHRCRIEQELGGARVSRVGLHERQ